MKSALQKTLKSDIQGSHMVTVMQFPIQLAYRAMEQTLTLVGCK